MLWLWLLPWLLPSLSGLLQVLVEDRELGQVEGLFLGLVLAVDSHRPVVEQVEDRDSWLDFEVDSQEQDQQLWDLDQELGLVVVDLVVAVGQQLWLVEHLFQMTNGIFGSEAY